MWTVPGSAADTSICLHGLGNPTLTAGPLRTLGAVPVTVDFSVVPGHTYLIEVDERNNDALVEALSAGNQLIAQADHPERRTGTRRAVLTAVEPRVTVRVTGKEDVNVAGTATVRLVDLADSRTRPDCVAILRILATADAEYAAGQEISRGLSTSVARSAREAFVRAAEGYSSAADALQAPGDRALRGQTALALAGVEYYDLQDWTTAAQWADSAATLLATGDPYRRARADSLAAAAWIEIASAVPAGEPVPGYGLSSTQLLARAREMMERLRDFHLARGERYDAGVQLSNIALSYLYEGRYSECIAAATISSHVFGSLQQKGRRAQAWQDKAQCLWGLGRLPEALTWFERALADISPRPDPRYFISAVTNTALANYALGQFDESLRLYDLALPLTRKIQSTRDEASCLYGIGVNYYALGDRERAREFLERSLAIRTVAVDGRGRMATLRALATIDAEEGRMDDAIASDREALGLAHAPSVAERIRTQLAAHMAAAGQLEQAKAQLDEIISAGAGHDPLLEAEALLRRVVVLRRLGLPREALTDLNAAQPRLHILGSVAQEFEADLERARTERILGNPDAALEAVEQAVTLSDAARLQTANPELRSQLQTPLRAAYDLEVELLREEYERAVAAGRREQATELAAAAFVAADASRAHSFAEVAAQEYPPVVRGALAPELKRREAIYQQLAARRFALDARLESGSDDPSTKRLISDITELQRQADTVNTLIATRTSPRAEVSVVRFSLPKVPAGIGLVSYWLGSESAYAWVVLPTGMHWARLSPPSEIEQQVAAFHRSLTRVVDVPAERRLENARTLYESIMRPMEAWLRSVRQWVIIPDGALDYVPFAALRVTGAGSAAFVAAQHDVALSPAAWMLNSEEVRGEPPGPGRMLLVADPVYQPDDPRLTPVATAAQASASRGLDAQTRQYQRLKYTAQEADQIRTLFPPADVDELIGLDATRERLLHLDLSKYRYIHIAAHGHVDAQVPQLSALVLGTYDASGRHIDGAVRVADLSLQTLKAEVAVFSACDTALGREVAGEGLVGIGSTVLARGARAVVASLWPVSDESGARLMTEFYRHLLHDSTGASAALGAAMRSVLSRDADADPALWAAFQVSVVTLAPGPTDRPIRSISR